MLCSNCNKKNAVVKFVSIFNGEKKEYQLCKDCAYEFGILSFSPFSLGDLFSQAISETEQVACTNCGMTLTEFKKLGVLGCAHCYEDLIGEVEPVLKHVQKGIVHVGRAPKNYKMPQESTNNIKSSDHEQRLNSVMNQDVLEIEKELSEKQKLEIALKQAVEIEDFEAAVKYRDQLRELNAKPGENIAMNNNKERANDE